MNNSGGQQVNFPYGEMTFDPIGSFVGLSESQPIDVPSPFTFVMGQFMEASTGKCYADYVETRCEVVQQMLNNGTGAHAPWDPTETVYNPITKKNELAIFTVDWDNGFYGFVPTGANYTGDGSWAWQSPQKGRPKLKPKGKAQAGQEDGRQKKFQRISWFMGTITDDMYNYVEKYYITPNYNDCASSYTGNPLPGKEQATLALAASVLDSTFAAKISGIWARESYLSLTPDGDAGPALLTTWWSRNHPELIVGNAYGSWNGRTKTSFDGSVRDNIVTLRNIVYFSHNLYSGSYYRTAYWYGPGDPNNPNNAPKNRKKYAEETIDYFNKFKPFFDCLASPRP